MNIDKIIYETCRELVNMEDKLGIATLFLFCYQYSTDTFSELLYCENKKDFLSKLNGHFKPMDIYFDVNLDNRNVSNSFNKTITEVIKQEDSNGFYKAVFHKDEFALACVEASESFKIFKNNLKLNKNE